MDFKRKRILQICASIEDLKGKEPEGCTSIEGRRALLQVCLVLWHGILLPFEFSLLGCFADQCFLVQVQVLLACAQRSFLDHLVLKSSRQPTASSHFSNPPASAKVLTIPQDQDI